MVHECGLCRKSGHNRRTCPDRVDSQPAQPAALPLPLEAPMPAVLCSPTTTLELDPVKAPIPILPLTPVRGQGQRDRDLPLRSTLPSLEQIWDFRDQIDAYSGLHRAVLLRPERDHVFEIQLLEAAYYSYLSDPRVGGRTTRSDPVHQNLKNLANCIENTNVTTQAINRSKKGPFTRVLHELKECHFDSMCCKYGVDDHFNAAKRKGRYPGLTSHSWSNIKREVVVTYDYILNQIPVFIIPSGDGYERKAEILGDKLHEVFIALKLE